MQSTHHNGQVAIKGCWETGASNGLMQNPLPDDECTWIFSRSLGIKLTTTEPTDKIFKLKSPSLRIFTIQQKKAAAKMDLNTFFQDKHEMLWLILARALLWLSVNTSWWKTSLWKSSKHSPFDTAEHWTNLHLQQYQCDPHLHLATGLKSLHPEEKCTAKYSGVGQEPANFWFENVKTSLYLKQSQN